MRNFFAFFISLLLIAAATSNSFAQFQYTNPVPGGKFVKSNTVITLVSEQPLEESSLFIRNMFTVKGSSSGKHDVEIKLLDDERTIILKPAKKFTADEMVT